MSGRAAVLRTAPWAPCAGPSRAPPAARLRDQVDLDEISAGLCATVVASVGPTRIVVRLNGPAGEPGG